ncbi:uncharacterized protein [Penaeus vannamei]|uniref:uncharacterized protein n=1 Tax=Penaeus vannamei TaxID=6689 RepID=UPI00387F8B6F
MQDSWLSDKANEIQGFAHKHDKKNFYDGLKEVYDPTSVGSSPLLSADGSTLITDKDKILERWAEHFDSVLNRPSTINDEPIDRLPQVPVGKTMDAVPTLEKIQKAVRLLFSGKAPGSDSIPAEVYKEGGNRHACDNHRGISLLSITGKILARVLLNRLITHLEQGLPPETQCGFR